MYSSSKKFLEVSNNIKPDVAVILGSGLTNFFDEKDIITSISYEELKDFPQPTVKGHTGKLVLGKIDNLNVVEPISAYHKECPTCGAKLFPVVHEKIDKNDPEESKADKVCHCCGKKFMVLFGC